MSPRSKTCRDRYEAVGLRNNPFTARDLPGGTVTPGPMPFVDRGLDAPPRQGQRTLVQVIGESGYGKSTHLRHWRSQAPGPLHYIVRRPYRDRWMTPPVAPLVYGDEIDRMPRPLRRRWFRDLRRVDATVVVGTHTDLRRLGRRFGFEVTTHVLNPMTVDELHELINRRLDHAATTGTARRIEFDSREIWRIHAASGGVPLEAEARCHELLAERVFRMAGAAQSIT